jgi:uncharacterized protein YlxW (UPF0749 family)
MSNDKRPEELSQEEIMIKLENISNSLEQINAKKAKLEKERKTLINSFKKYQTLYNEKLETIKKEEEIFKNEFILINSKI